jgi:glucose/arabinose dehydrogenase
MIRRILVCGAGLAILSMLVASGALTSRAQEPTTTPTVQPTQQTEGTPQGLANAIEGSAVIPETLPFERAYLERLQLPDGFEVNVFAENVGNVRMMAVAPDGTILVTRRMEGDVIALSDADGNGVADGPFTVVAANLPYVHGITINSNQVYLVTDTTLYTAPVGQGGALGALQPLINDLPTGGQHPNRTLAFGPDGLLYITVGSTCNACDEPDPENATILRARPSGASREIFAEGLRNTIGFGWHPVTGEMWGFDHGSDWRGDDQPPEELNRLEFDTNYGWPWCFGQQQPDVYIPAAPPGDLGRAAYCHQTTPPVLEYTAHSAPIGFVFYTGTMFPEEYVNDAFVPMRGSWNRSEPSGYKIVRVLFDENGQPTDIQDFMTGFLIPEQIAHFGRVAGIVVAPDGSLLISEDDNGVIYRVAYTGQ